MRRDSSFLVKKQGEQYSFDSVTELKYFFADENIFNIPQISKDEHMVIVSNKGKKTSWRNC